MFGWAWPVLIYSFILALGMARTSKLGKFEMPPKMSMSEAIGFAKKAVHQFRSAEFTDSGLASLFGHETAKSGAFRQRQADLRRFGLIEGRGNKLKASAAAQTIYAPGPGELGGALSSVAFRIPLYSALYDKYKGSVPSEEDFLTTLVDLTGLPRSELMEHVKTLLGLYRDVCGTLGVAPPGPGAPPTRTFERTDTAPPGTPARFESSAGEFTVSVVDDPEAIDRLIGLLDARKKMHPSGSRKG
jgi:hypothetical protein